MSTGFILGGRGDSKIRSKIRAVMVAQLYKYLKKKRLNSILQKGEF